MARARTSFLRISRDARDTLRRLCRKKGLIMGTAASEAITEFCSKNGFKVGPSRKPKRAAKRTKKEKKGE